ncbi:MurR/RpiR family transcriptional regulator [Staphylococcus pseudintermedius]|nr:MurR/RpiR family transcriptional regulator [Staphylococcus pseudintermedius]EGQ1600727.1 MurR/RpiR family transcriptional regulator [Staphylococcus pseudintermedius]EGQ2878960.1 MurR/RpiR family transcriptional regulator [Staphylococcus pseudintermedius]EGQ2937690.1 MurR/RpiR family transcriptional regulator [Staphylococcus pseudintermedius]EGQ2963648.1 MurR/RpiR family transcriptional regulator [Staphylococcus pseudintermedius]EGQ3229525.1 MurR/RpiR family transcriptional regulator [Staphy
MRFYKVLVPMIESNLENMTTTEKEVAQFFLKQVTVEDLSSEMFSNQLHVSKATLTRFAKKCGFTGFREFLFHYREMMREKEDILAYKDLIQKVLFDYEEMLRKNYSILNESQLEHIKEMINQAERVYLYGKGSSALALKEMKMRFMRLGIICEVIEDNDMLVWNNLLVDASCLVIGASISGKTSSVLHALKRAKAQGAQTVLMTTRNFNAHEFGCDEILLLAAAKHLSYGNVISPQFPILLMTDCLFSYYLEDPQRGKYYDQTIIDKEA